MNRLKRWLQVTVDNKPWWAIILAAFLASLGSEPLKRIPDLITWTRSFYPIEPTIYVYLRGTATASPIDGGRVSVLDSTSGAFLPIQGVNQTFVMTHNGF